MDRPTGGEFVRRLKVEVLGTDTIWRGDASAALSDAEPKGRRAYVAAASVVSFAEGVSGQQREDLLNSTLLAQLAANHQADRERDTLNWYEAYRGVLRGVGWRSERLSDRLPPILRRAETVRALGTLGVATPMRPLPRRPEVSTALPALQFNRLNMTQPRFTAGDSVIASLRKGAGEDVAVRTGTVLEALRGLGDRDRRVVIFESSSHGAGRGNFQIVSAECGPDLIIRMTMVAVFFSTDESVPRVMSFQFGRSGTQMFHARDTMTLAPSDYDDAREQVIQQLGDQAAAYIAEIPLGA